MSHLFPQRADIHPPHVKQEALALVAIGANDCEISRRLGIPRATIRDWRRPTYVSRRRFDLETCLRCWRATKPVRFTPADYTELLGFYLGDGCISAGARTFRLRVSLDLKYPRLIERLKELLIRSFPANRVDVVTAGVKGHCAVVSVYSQHLPCLLPQHGPGKKHARAIELEAWQEALVDHAPWGLIRGLIYSDGCSFINRHGRYRDLSYDFTNMSEDITRLFVRACTAVGVTTRVANGNKRGIWQVRINQRPSVALMLEHVGKKS